MIKFCGQCGTSVTEGAKFCAKCGNMLVKPLSEHTPEPTPPETEVIGVSAEQKLAEEETLAAAFEDKIEIVSEAVVLKEEKPAVAENKNAEKPKAEKPEKVKVKKEKKAEKKAAKKEKKANKPKKSKKGLIVLLIIVVVLAIIGLGIFLVGDYFSLKSHSAEVAQEFNEGNYSKMYNKEMYADLPLYVVEMMGESKDEEEPSPLLEAMSPYITFEVEKVSAFMGSGKVEYRVVSRDLYDFVLSADTSKVETAEEFQQILIDQIPDAPAKEYTIVIEYSKEDYGWRGDYSSAEFTDIITGGMNRAYNKLYEQMIEEMEELLNE